MEGIEVVSVRPVSVREIRELQGMKLSSDIHTFHSVALFTTKHYAKCNLAIPLSCYVNNHPRHIGELRQLVINDCISHVAFQGVYSSLFTARCVLAAIRYESSNRRFIVNLVIQLNTL